MLSQLINAGTLVEGETLGMEVSNLCRWAEGNIDQIVEL